MSSLQLGLIVAGVVLVVGVIIYNWLTERRVRRRINEAFPTGAGTAETTRELPPGASSARVEPTLPTARETSAARENVPRASVEPDVEGYEPPLQIHARIASEIESGDIPPEPSDAGEASAFGGPKTSSAERNSNQPDP